MKATRKALAAAMLAAMLLAIPANAGGHYGRYRQTNDAARVTHVRIRVACIDAEDSAAHLRLREYGDGRAVYGCEHKGY